VLGAGASGFAELAEKALIDTVDLHGEAEDVAAAVYGVCGDEER
jgi:hypothetical protein